MKVNQWLVVTDMQVVFSEHDSPWFVPRFDETVPNIMRLVREYGDRVVYTRFVPLEDPFDAWVDYYNAFPFARKPETAPKYSLIPKFTPNDSQLVDQRQFNKMGEELRTATNDARDIAIVGVSTDTCVISTALSAVSSGVGVTVVEDGCAGKSDKSHQNACDVMAMYEPMIKMTTTDQLLA